MKKALLPLALLFATLHGYAQITVTQSAYPVAGDTWIEYSDFVDSGYVITPPSANAQNWDYSKVFQLSDSTIEAFGDASNLPSSDSFPGAKLGVHNSTYDLFYSDDATGFYYTGAYFAPSSGNYFSVQAWNPANLLLPVPFSYGSTRHFTARSVVERYDSSLHTYSRQITFYDGNFTADAFGTITTPAVSNAAVLRLNDSYHEYDTIYIGKTAAKVDSLFDTTKLYYTNYYFVQNKSPFTLMELDYYPAAQSLNAAFYFSASSSANSVPGVNASSSLTNVYPNPASSRAITFTIESANAKWLKIYNISGECVETENVTGINSLTISNSLLPRGMYLYRITDSAGNIIGGRKFVLQ